MPPDPIHDEALLLAHWFPGGGAVGAQVRSHPWATTAVGPPSQWPEVLRSAVRLVLDARSPMFVWWGAELTCFYNDGCIPLLGGRHPDALGRSARAVWSDVWGTLGRLVDAILAGGDAASSGPLSGIVFACSPISTDDGRAGGVFCICNVASRHRQRDSERRWQTLAETLPQIVWTARPDGWLEYISPRWTALTGMAAEESLGHRWQRALHPDDFGRVAAVCRQAIGSGATHSVEARLRHGPDGPYRWHLHRGAPLHDEVGQLVQWVGTSTDIDDRKRAEEAWRESEERLRVALEAAKLGSWEMDRTTGVLTASATCKAHLGRGADDPLSRLELMEGVPPEERNHVRDAVKQAVAEGGAFDVECPFVWPDGSQHWIHTRGRALYDAAGELLRLVGVTQDVSERRSAANAIAQLNADLGGALAEAEEAGRAKDEFLAVLSHELRSPLSAMLGWIRILAKERGEEALVTRAVETLERNLWIQVQLIDDLLDVSRIRSGKLDLDLVRIDLGEAVAGCIDSIRPSAEARGVTVAIDLAGEPPAVRADGERLQQIIHNLLDNALKFTPQGGTVSVRVGRVHDVAEIRVSDTGAGIAPELLRHVFERFRQADSSTTRRHRGLGLGLAIVKHLTEAHGGTVDAKSPGPGCGSTFVVTLPLAPPAALAPDTPPVPREERASAIRDLEYLLVEDDDDTRAAVAIGLQHLGVRVRCAASTGEALEAYRARRPDVLISDIAMPGEDGYTLIRRVRELDRERVTRTPAIAMTGFATRFDQETALRAGFDEHVGKPIDTEALLERLRVLTASRH